MDQNGRVRGNQKPVQGVCSSLARVYHQTICVRQIRQINFCQEFKQKWRVYLIDGYRATIIISPNRIEYSDFDSTQCFELLMWCSLPQDRTRTNIQSVKDAEKCPIVYLWSQ